MLFAVEFFFLIVYELNGNCFILKALNVELFHCSFFFFLQGLAAITT